MPCAANSVHERWKTPAAGLRRGFKDGAVKEAAKLAAAEDNFQQCNGLE